MTNNVSTNKFCSGCGACIAICPAKALKFGSDDDGFYKPVIDGAECLNCGKCLQMCPFNNPKYNNTANPQCYAFTGTPETESTSTTAGGFQVMARHFLQNGGKVVGAAWGKDLRVEHVMVDNTADLPKLYKSKYVQSFTGDIYAQTKRALDKGEKILFSGVPCQIAGLYATLGKEYSNLWTAGLVCNHQPSPRHFLNWTREKFGKDNLLRFDFRAKGESGNSALHYYYCCKDGKKGIVAWDQDIFIKGFLSQIGKGGHCEACPFAKLPRQEDLTLADFWGIEKYEPKYKEKTTQAALVNNEKGRELLDIIKAEFPTVEPKSLRFLKKKNPRIKSGANAHKNRDYYFALAKNMPVLDALDHALNDKYEIGVCGMPSNTNYGGALTYFALYHALLDCGKIPLLIDPPSVAYGNENRSNYYKDPFAPYSVARRYKNKTEMRSALNPKCDMFLVGSDQMLSELCYDYTDRIALLNFVEDRKKKAAYGVSFGFDSVLEQFDDKTCAQMAYFLGKFDYFSVREQSGVALCQNELGINATWVLDPVFICDRKHYDELAQRSGFPQNMIVTYILDDNPLCRQITKDLQEKLGAPALNLLCGGKRSDKIKVEDWVSAIANAKFVFTDSFHGMCFAIIYNKPFYALCNKRRGAARFESIAGALGLRDRVIYSLADYKNNENDLKTDYSLPNQKLEKLKQESLAELKKAVEPLKTKKHLSDYDMILGLSGRDGNADKRIPRWLGAIICGFIPKRKNRHRFMRKHVKTRLSDYN
jgi:NAD-dependent dihydropyrimidine dehydrogenase PreA subunit